MKETLKKRGSNVNRHALLMDPMADDSDFLCFFKAIVLTKLYHDTVKDYHKTGALQANKKRLLGEARHLAAASGIKVRPQVRYGEKHAQAVQDYFELVNPGKYRLVIFSKNRGTTPAYNGGVNADITLCVYHEDDHFHAVKNPRNTSVADTTASRVRHHSDARQNIRSSARSSARNVSAWDAAFPAPATQTSIVTTATRRSKHWTDMKSISG